MISPNWIGLTEQISLFTIFIQCYIPGHSPGDPLPLK